MEIPLFQILIIIVIVSAIALAFVALHSQFGSFFRSLKDQLKKPSMSWTDIVMPFMLLNMAISFVYVLFTTMFGILVNVGFMLTLMCSGFIIPFIIIIYSAVKALRIGKGKKGFKCSLCMRKPLTSVIEYIISLGNLLVGSPTEIKVEDLNIKYFDDEIEIEDKKEELPKNWIAQEPSIIEKEEEVKKKSKKEKEFKLFKDVNAKTVSFVAELDKDEHRIKNKIYTEFINNYSKAVAVVKENDWTYWEQPMYAPIKLILPNGERIESKSLIFRTKRNYMGLDQLCWTEPNQLFVIDKVDVGLDEVLKGDFIIAGVATKKGGEKTLILESALTKESVDLIMNRNTDNGNTNIVERENINNIVYNGQVVRSLIIENKAQDQYIEQLETEKAEAITFAQRKWKKEKLDEEIAPSKSLSIPNKLKNKWTLISLAVIFIVIVITLVVIGVIGSYLT